MRDEKNDFNIHLGDTIYSDSEVGGVPPALTVEEKWEKYRLNISEPNLYRLRKSAGFYSHWDDHEFINDFSIPEDGEQLYRAGVKAFRNYAPVVLGRGGSLPHLPLGQEPRALLPRPALVPLREGRFRGSMRHPRHRRSRPRAHRSAIDAERVRPVIPSFANPGLAAVQERDQRSRGRCSARISSTSSSRTSTAPRPGGRSSSTRRRSSSSTASRTTAGRDTRSSAFSCSTSPAARRR